MRPEVLDALVGKVQENADELERVNNTILALKDEEIALLQQEVRDLKTKIWTMKQRMAWLMGEV